MKAPLSLVRWVPVLLVAAACSDVTSPTAYAGLDPAFAKGGNGADKGAQSVAYEPFRLEQRTVYADVLPAVVRQCQLNSFEDLDGNDVERLSASGTSLERRTNEKDAFIAVREAAPGSPPANQGLWTVVGVGRASWQSVEWYFADADGDPDGQISVNSHAAGVIAPLDAVSAATRAAVLASILRDVPGGDDGDNGEHDLANAPLGPGDAPVDVINQALREADEAGALVGVKCDWEGGIKAYTTHGTTYESTWPNSLKKLWK